ncbi:hypothetical protein B0O99DRAFT_272892 [Bisporella sp. PMI_857]|nr:hypothetical protein B0O99DRAFT_272892 [Bisporella sp. PMI_857]
MQIKAFFLILAAVASIEAASHAGCACKQSKTSGFVDSITNKACDYYRRTYQKDLGATGLRNPHSGQPLCTIIKNGEPFGGIDGRHWEASCVAVGGTQFPWKGYCEDCGFTDCPQ